MRKHVQKPAGWWQDSANRAQPPGSYSDPMLRDPPEPARAPSWVQRIVAAALHRA